MRAVVTGPFSNETFGNRVLFAALRLEFARHWNFMRPRFP